VKNRRKKQLKSDIFVAIDFETADRLRDSACAVAMVRVESGKIVHKEHRFIKPPRKYFEFTYLHGITWDMVASEPNFQKLWSSLKDILNGIDFIAAHNASFDRSVLNACCEKSNIVPPSIPFQCTVSLAREKWGIYPTKLPNVCNYLNIPLNHHEALSDAMACAKIVIAASTDYRRNM
jgi:DNA polymerase III subunit epsilon